MIATPVSLVTCRYCGQRVPPTGICPKCGAPLPMEDVPEPAVVSRKIPRLNRLIQVCHLGCSGNDKFVSWKFMFDDSEQTVTYKMFEHPSEEWSRMFHVYWKMPGWEERAQTMWRISPVARYWAEQLHLPLETTEAWAWHFSRMFDSLMAYVEMAAYGDGYKA